MSEPLELGVATSLFARLVDELFEADRLQEAFGYWCVDRGDVPGGLGTSPSDALLLETGRSNLSPVSEHHGSWDEDTFMDAVELYFALVSVGDPDHPDSSFHDYSDCGWHYAAFTREPAASEYRSAVNKILGRYGQGFEMNTAGQVERAVADGIDELIETGSVGTPLDVDDEALVSGAIAKFKRRDLSSRRDAVRDLAAVLERLRLVAPRLMTRKDEGPLFEIVNAYAIRHNKPDQKRDYDQDVWWDWVFHMQLASIRLIQQLQARAAEARGEVDLLVDDLLGGASFYKGTLAQRFSDLPLAQVPRDDQQRIGQAVGRRCVGATGVVINDGLRACIAANDVDVWPAAYRAGLVEGLLFDLDGHLDTAPGLMAAAVRVLLPVDSADEEVERLAATSVNAALSADVGVHLVARQALAKAIRDAASQLSPGRQREAWRSIASRFDDAS